MPEIGNPLDAWTAGKLGLSGSSFSRSDLVAYQMRQLRQTVAWAKQRSPFYRRVLHEIDEATLNTPDDLHQLPFTTADDLRRNDPPLLCVSQDEISRVVTLETSGTTGTPKRLFFTTEEQEATLDFFHRGMQLPARASDRVLILFPGERPGSVGDLLGAALNRLGAIPIQAGWPQNLPAAVALLRSERPDVVAGAPVPMLALARYAAALGQAPVRVRSVLLSSDHAAASLRRALADLWQCEIFEHYGMTEMALGGGVDCAAHDGYHMRENELLIEIVAPETGEPVPTGEAGEVVFTTLARRGMPLIRYRSGDLSRLLPGACACGSPLARLNRIHGRIAGGIDLGSAGTLTMAALDEALFAVDGVADFSAAVRPGSPPSLHLDILSVADVAPGDIRAALAGFGPQVTMAISADDQLRSGVGKRRIATETSA
jgi:phenylacetate-coenzyme A ligase PaaK-like adenylate-forming protein